LYRQISLHQPARLLQVKAAVLAAAAKLNVPNEMPFFSMVKVAEAVAATSARARGPAAPARITSRRLNSAPVILAAAPGTPAVKLRISAVAPMEMQFVPSP